MFSMFLVHPFHRIKDQVQKKKNFQKGKKDNQNSQNKLDPNVPIVVKNSKTNFEIKK
jgi:hypothetical protein